MSFLLIFHLRERRESQNILHRSPELPRPPLPEVTVYFASTPPGPYAWHEKIPLQYDDC